MCFRAAGISPEVLQDFKMCLRASWRALRKKHRRRLVARWTPHRNDAVTRERRKSGHSEGMEGLVRKRVCSLLLSRKSEIARESRTRAREVGRQENRLIARSKWQSSALNFKTIRLTEENLNSWCRRGETTFCDLTISFASTRSAQPVGWSNFATCLFSQPNSL